MTDSRSRFLLSAVIIAATVATAEADPIAIGAPGNAASCLPFGCRDAARYQQLYAAELFPGIYTIASIAFPHTIDSVSNQIDPAAYEIRLSTSSSLVGSPTLNDTVGGPGSTVVVAGALSGSVPPGGALVFNLPVPFIFDPSAGNLLLDVIKHGGIFFGDDGIYLDANLAPTAQSSAVWLNTAGAVNSTGPLVTVFSSDPAPTPEPATLVLFGTGIAGSLLARRRGRARERSATTP